jgi:ubiquinone/menaquinone biosynthesis C-methylase UbiE
MFVARLAHESRNSLNVFPSHSPIGSASFLVPARIDQAELLDQGEGSLEDVRANFDEMWRINKAFAGVRSLTQYLNLQRHSPNQPVRIVDLGTGSGRLALYLQKWGQKHHLEIQVYPLDLSPRNLHIAQENIQSRSNIHLIQADGLALPFAPKSVDYFISSLFMHHFSPDALISLLRETYRLARHGLIMSDIVRGYLPLAAFRLVQPIFARHYLTRHDGILSIKRAYTPAELLEMARAAGIENARVSTHFPWRMTLVADKPDV